MQVESPPGTNVAGPAGLYWLDLARAWFDKLTTP